MYNNSNPQTGFPTAHFQDNSVAFHRHSHEETSALDVIHRNDIQTKPQWLSAFSARNYYIKSIHCWLTLSSLEDKPEKKKRMAQKNLSSCTDLGKTGYVVMARYPPRQDLCGVFSNLEGQEAVRPGRQRREKLVIRLTSVALRHDGVSRSRLTNVRQTARQELRF